MATLYVPILMWRHEIAKKCPHIDMATSFNITCYNSDLADITQDPKFFLTQAIDTMIQYIFFNTATG